MPASLAQLEARVAALEAGATGAETNSPNYLTLSPAGLVGALFRGGVQLVEGIQQAYNAAQALAWQDGGGVLRAYLTAWLVANNHNCALESIADANDHAQIQLTSRAAGGAGTAVVSASAYDSAVNSRYVQIIDSLSNSDFLQLPSTKQLAVDCGYATPAWGGASQQSATLSVSHALGRAPSAVVAVGAEMSDGGGQGAYAAIDRTVWDSAHFGLKAVCYSRTPANGATLSCYWIAIG